MPKRLAAIVIALLVAACGITRGHVPWRADIDACDVEAGRSPQVGSQAQRLAYVGRCMEAKGWRPTASCRYNQMEGSPAFCDYER